jgi:hypothetical protein
MKKTVGWSLAVLFTFTMVSVFLVSQDQDQERIVEKVTVTNIEVPVRVLYKGKPVTDLTAADFTVYENKKKVTINGFFKKSKTLTFKSAAAGEVAGPPPEPRTFVLIFNVSNYNTYFEKAVNYLFDKILTPHDRLMIFANDKTHTYDNLKEIQKVKTQLVADLKVEGLKAKQRLLNYIRRVEALLNVNDFTRKLSRRDGGMALRAINFLKKYILTWNEYQRNFLVPKTDRFYYFSRYLEKLKGQKWVLNFYQFEFFPRIRPTSRTMEELRDRATELQHANEATDAAQGQNLTNLIRQIDSDLEMGKNFPNEQITKLFYKVDATFHSFFIKSTNTAFLGDMSYTEVSSDVERILKGITDITGGKNLTSTDLVSSLEAVTKVEDTYYVLTYVPQDAKKVGKLKIKVKGKKYKVLYDDNFRVDYINHYFNTLEQKIKTPDVKIKDFSFKEKILAFTVVQYLIRQVEENKKTGQLKVRIRVTDEDNKGLWDQSKVLTAMKAEFKISLPTFKTIRKGEYNFILDVTDMFTGKSASFTKSIIIKK